MVILQADKTVDAQVIIASCMHVHVPIKQSTTYNIMMKPDFKVFSSNIHVYYCSRALK